jgi:GDPmannose 4,6-dehydratase
MWRMLQQDTPEDYVAATGQTHTILDFIDFVSDVAGFNLMEHVHVDDAFKRPSEVPLLMGDASKAKEKLGWRPTTSVKQLARIMYNNDLKLEQEGLQKNE